jgi:hypothetical protein
MCLKWTNNGKWAKNAANANQKRPTFKSMQLEFSICQMLHCVDGVMWVLCCGRILNGQHIQHLELTTFALTE